MLARLQQFTTIGLLAAALAWFGLHAARGEPGLAAVGALSILFGYAAILALEFLLMWRSNQRDALPPPRLGEVVRAWWGEVSTAPRVFCWEQPFRSHALPDRLTGHDGQRGLVLVHGFLCNRGVWNSWLPRLAESGIPHVALSLEPVFGDIDDYAGQIEAAVISLRRSTGLAPVVVAHSMGGLAVRAWLNARRSQGGEHPVHHVVTLGTPHRGTALARFAFSSNTRQMVPTSGWLDGMSGREPAEERALFTCLYSNCDNIVFPTSVATLPHARRRALDVCAHVQMVFRQEAYDEVIAHLGSALPSQGTGPSAFSPE